MANKAHLNALFSRLQRTPEFQRVLQIIENEPTKDGKIAVVKYWRQLTNDVMLSAGNLVIGDVNLPATGKKIG